MKENWLPVLDWPAYEVSDLGRVRRVGSARGTRREVMRGSTDRYGYRTVNLSDRGRRRNAKVHRLVADAFLGPLPTGMETRHLNGDPSDPRLCNLAFGTHAQNMRDMVEHGRSSLSRTECPHGHPYSPQNTYVDHRGNRNCRACMNAQKLARSRRLRAEANARGELYFRNVRRWGRANGWSVADTGRIAQDLLAAYDRIHLRTQKAAA